MSELELKMADSLLIIWKQLPLSSSSETSFKCTTTLKDSECYWISISVKFEFHFIVGTGVTQVQIWTGEEKITRDSRLTRLRYALSAKPSIIRESNCYKI